MRTLTYYKLELEYFFGVFKEEYGELAIFFVFICVAMLMAKFGGL